jgi:hypothetical protein
MQMELSKALGRPYVHGELKGGGELTLLEQGELAKLIQRLRRGHERFERYTHSRTVDRVPGLDDYETQRGKVPYELCRQLDEVVLSKEREAIRYDKERGLLVNIRFKSSTKENATIIDRPFGPQTFAEALTMLHCVRLGAVTEWEFNFVDSMREKLKSWGSQTWVSEEQYVKLEELAYRGGWREP